MANGLDINVIKSGNGFNEFVPAEEMQKRDDALIAASRPKSDATPALASYVQDKWMEVQRAKQLVEQEMLAAERDVKGEYEPAKLQQIRQLGLSEDYIRMTLHKCRDAEAWICEPYVSGDKTWSVEPRPVAEIPEKVRESILNQTRMQFLQQSLQQFTAMNPGAPIDINAIRNQINAQSGAISQATSEIEHKVKMEVQRVAEEKSTSMEQYISTQLETGGFYKALVQCIQDLTRFKSCIMKGPIWRKAVVPKWVEDGQGNFVPDLEEKVIACFERVSPFNYYPTAKSKEVGDGDLIEIEPLRRSTLVKMKGVPGYKDDAIDKIISANGKGHEETTSISYDRHVVEKQNMMSADDDVIESINFWGSVQGQMLLDWGMDSSDVPDATKDYEINCKMVNGVVYKSVLNPDPFGNRPYSVTSMVKSADSQWGEGVPDLMKDIKNRANQIVRNASNNIAYAAGPVTVKDTSRMVNPDQQVKPFTELEAKNVHAGAGPVIQHIEIPFIAHRLYALLESLKREADEQVIPSFQGTEGKGADKTFGGRQLRMTAAMKTVNVAINNIDTDVIQPVVERLYNYNMKYINDNSIKGDNKVVVKGSRAQVLKDQRAERQMQMVAALSPEEKQIMGMKGLAYVLREKVKAVELDPFAAIPAYDDIERASLQEQPGQPQQVAQ